MASQSIDICQKIKNARNVNLNDKELEQVIVNKLKELKEWCQCSAASIMGDWADYTFNFTPTSDLIPIRPNECPRLKFTFTEAIRQLSLFYPSVDTTDALLTENCVRSALIYPQINSISVGFGNGEYIRSFQRDLAYNMIGNLSKRTKEVSWLSVQEPNHLVVLCGDIIRFEFDQSKEMSFCFPAFFKESIRRNGTKGELVLENNTVYGYTGVSEQIFNPKITSPSLEEVTEVLAVNSRPLVHIIVGSPEEVASYTASKIFTINTGSDIDYVRKLRQITFSPPDQNEDQVPIRYTNIERSIPAGAEISARNALMEIENATSTSTNEE